MGVFNRLGYNFDSTKFGSGNNLTAGQAQLLNSGKSLKTWQADDLINVSASGYFQNPHITNLTILTTLANSLLTNANTSNITFTYASSSANNLNLAANNVLLEIPSFTDHTNRISGVTSTTNGNLLPDYQIAMSVGRQVLSITNQIDGVQNNAPLLGNFTSLAIGGDIANTIILLTNDLATLNNSISLVGGNLVSNITSSSMNTIVSDVQSAYTLLNGRRTADTNFYLNSLALVSDYNKVSQFTTVGVNSNYLINTLNIGTDKLKYNLQSTTTVPSIVNSGVTTPTTISTSTYSSTSPGLSPTGVVAGTYTNSTMTVDTYGRINYASNGSTSVANTQITGTITPAQLTSGVPVQVVFKSWSDSTTSTTTYTYVTTTNGTLNITSKLTNSKFLVHFSGQGYLSGAGGVNIGLSRTISGTTTRLVGVDGGSGDTWMGSGNGAGTNSWAIAKNYLDSPSQTAGTTITYNLLLGLWSGGTIYLGYPGYPGYATITITEIAP